MGRPQTHSMHQGPFAAAGPPQHALLSLLFLGLPVEDSKCPQMPELPVPLRPPRSNPQRQLPRFVCVTPHVVLRTSQCSQGSTECRVCGRFRFPRDRSSSGHRRSATEHGTSLRFCRPPPTPSRPAQLLHFGQPQPPLFVSAIWLGHPPDLRFLHTKPPLTPPLLRQPPPPTHGIHPALRPLVRFRQATVVPANHIHPRPETEPKRGTPSACSPFFRFPQRVPSSGDGTP